LSLQCWVPSVKVPRGLSPPDLRPCRAHQSANGVGLKTAIGPKRIDELYSGQTLLIPQIAPVLANPEIDQQIGVVQWDIAFLPIVAPSLDGRVAFGATGGHFPYYITFVYDSPGAPDVVLSCQPLP
jgi:hypothetical protein